MSSNACRTVLFPEPERPVRMTSCRASCLACGFTGGAGSTTFPAPVGAGDAHVFAVLRDGSAGDLYAGVIEFLGYLFRRQTRIRFMFFNRRLSSAGGSL